MFLQHRNNLLLHPDGDTGVETPAAEAPAKETAKKPVKKKSGSEIFTLSFKLMIIIASVVLMLALVNQLTKDTIAMHEKQQSDEARTELFPDADDFALYSGNIPSSASKYVSEIYEAKKSGTIEGYCMSVTASGFGGKITMILGVSRDGVINGLKIISHTETAGFGDKIIGNGSLQAIFTNISQTSIDSVSAVSGATITSNAVIAAVKSAFSAALELISEGGY